MKIALLVEGETEKAFLPALRTYLQSHLAGEMPRFAPQPYNGRIPKEAKLQRVVQNLLSGRDACDHVIALTDVYTGTQPPEIFLGLCAQLQGSMPNIWVPFDPEQSASVSQTGV